MKAEVFKAIEDAEKNALVSGTDTTVLSGFSGKKLIGALQRLAALWDGDNDVCYLEIGVFQGLTLLSVAQVNAELPCYGIDNFAFFDKEHKNEGIVLQRQKKLGADNSFLINSDYEDALENLEKYIAGKKVAVLFVDGPHDYRSQLMSIALCLPYLHQDALIVVDDCNYQHVRQANRDFLKTHDEFALVFEAYTSRHPANMDKSERKDAENGWWNGVNVISRDADRLLERIFPPTQRDRTLFEQEHIIHASNLASHVVDALPLMQFIAQKQWKKMPRAIFDLHRKLRKGREANSKLYPAVNTYSEEISGVRYAEIAKKIG